MEKKASYYDWMCAHDIVEQLKPLWEQAGYYLRESDGKLTVDARIAIDTPWHHIKNKWDFDCGLWHRIVFDYISKRLPAQERFVPSRCQQCFKVVVRPKTLKQLFALEALQIRLQRPSKCGIEPRATVCGLYGGYFYNDGLEEALERYREVRSAVDADQHLGPDVSVIVKRGCTEYELECGPSDKWAISDVQLKFEALVNQYVAHDDVMRSQPEHLVWHLHRKWIEFAYANGDLTYLEFTDGKPLYPPVVTYHHLINTPSDTNDVFALERVEDQNNGKHTSEMES
jgi:hypothetical protein